MSQANTIPAESGKPCNCCGRKHRTLVLIPGGFWVGKTCAMDVKLYRENSNINSLIWRGYERQHAKVARMLGQ